MIISLHPLKIPLEKRISALYDEKGISKPWPYQNRIILTILIIVTFDLILTKSTISNQTTWCNSGMERIDRTFNPKISSLFLYLNSVWNNYVPKTIKWWYNNVRIVNRAALSRLNWLNSNKCTEISYYSLHIKQKCW